MDADDTFSEEQFLIHPEGHDDSDQINSVPWETNENDQDGANNANVENTGVVVCYLLILSHIHIFFLYNTALPNKYLFGCLILFTIAGSKSASEHAQFDLGVLYIRYCTHPHTLFRIFRK